MELDKLKNLMGSPQIVEDLGLIKRLNDYLEYTYNKAPEFAKKPSHSPSSFGSHCLRKLYYTYWRVPNGSPIDARGARIFEFGHHTEDMIMEWLKATGQHIPYRNKGNLQIPLNTDGSGKSNPQFPISVPSWRVNKGYIDNVGYYEKELWLYEIKSTNLKKFESLKAPLPEHLIQGAFYFTAFNEAIQNGEYSHVVDLSPWPQAKGIKYIYLCKNDSNLKIFSVTNFDTQVTEIANKVNALEVFIKAKALPPKTPDQCIWCPYQSQCKKNWNLSN